MNKSTVILIALAGLAYIVFLGLGDALTPLLLSFALAYLCFPLVQKLEAKGVQRHQAVIGIFGVLTLILAGVLIAIVPKIASELQELLAQLPSSITKGIARIEEGLAILGLNVELSKQQVFHFIQKNLKSIPLNLFGNVATGITGFFLSILNLFLIPIFFFYLIYDYERITQFLHSLVPRKYHSKLKGYLERSNSILGGYIRGQLVVALCLSLLYSIGLSIVGLKFGFLIGLIAGLISVIPYAGVSIGFSLAMIMNLAHYTGMGPILSIIGIFVLGQTIEGFFLTPRLIGNKLGLSAFATVLALIIGGNLLGLIGMLAAIPTAAILKFVLSDLFESYQKLDIIKNQ